MKEPERYLFIHMATRSAEPAKNKYKASVYAYLDDPTVTITNSCVCNDAGETVPLESVRDEGYVLVAWNAEFTRYALKSVALIDTAVERWRSVDVWEVAVGGRRGMPRTIEEKRLLLTAPEQLTPQETELKRRLIEKECHLVRSHWQALKERGEEPRWEEWHTHCKINERGVRVSGKLIEAYDNVQREARTAANKVLGEHVGTEEPTDYEVLRWLNARGVQMEAVTKADLRQPLHEGQTDDPKRTPEERNDLKRVAVALLTRYLFNSTRLALFSWRYGLCGNVLRGAYVYHASCTGRWASWGANLHNLPGDGTEDEVRQGLSALASGDWRTVVRLSEGKGRYWLLRAALVPFPGDVFIKMDYKQIEARVVAWLAGFTERIDDFRLDKDIYKMMAGAIYGKAPEKVTPQERSVGKRTVLALGYGGGAGLLVEKYGWSRESARRIMDAWRSNNAPVLAFSERLGEALREVVRRGAVVKVGEIELKPSRQEGMVSMLLPGGRVQHVEIPSKSNAGATLLALAAQGMARDIFANALVRLEEEGVRVRMHKHDEVVMECKEQRAEAVLRKAKQIMTTPPDWCRTLPLAVKSEVQRYYR